MENSTEEDIAILENIIEEYENCSVPEIDMQVNVTFREEQNNALNHILSDYKRVLKENEEWQRAYQEEKDEQFDLLIRIKGNYILIQKVKDKLKEYKNTLKTCNKAKDIDRIKAINERILELQELLESEE